MNILATATGKAVSTFTSKLGHVSHFGHGTATATMLLGVGQETEAGALGSNLLTNSGAMVIGASATQTSNERADAGALVLEGGILQFNVADGAGGNTLVTTGNSTLTIGATANAVSNFSDAEAFAGMGFGIVQEAPIEFVVGSATITNSGMTNILVSANATAFETASAAAVLGVGVGQIGVAVLPTAGDVGLDSLTNNGNLSIMAVASATGSAKAPFGEARDAALIDGGVIQGAVEFGTAGVALDTLTNSGNLTVAASALGTAHGRNASSTAFAFVGFGVVQADIAGGTGAAIAFGNLTNTGSLLISSTASATSDSAKSTPTRSSGLASASWRSTSARLATRRTP